jgi:hypothetical protein
MPIVPIHLHVQHGFSVGAAQAQLNLARPAKQTSSVAFGGKDLTDIFITSAGRSEPTPVMPKGYDPHSGYFGGRQMLRVLKSNGCLIYKDFALPKWLASLGRKTSKSLGYLTADDLNRFAEENRLVVVYLAGSLNKYEALWRKSA